MMWLDGLKRFWHRLTDPDERVSAPQERHHARVLSTLLILLFPLALLWPLLLLLLGDAPTLSWQMLVLRFLLLASVGWLLPYRLTRMGHHRWVIWGAIVVVSLGLFADALVNHKPRSLDSLVFVILFANIFIPIRATCVLALLHLVGLLLIPRLVPGLVLLPDMLRPLGFLLLGSTLILLLRDQRDRFERAQRRELVDSEARYRTLLESTFEGVATVINGKVVEANSGLARLFGYAESEIVGLPFLTLLAELSRGAVEQQLENGSSEPCEAVAVRKDGSTFHIELAVSLHLGQRQREQVIALRDISDRKGMEEALVHDASHDTLTMLPNRAYFMERLSQALARMRRWRSYKFAVLFLDLDRFKTVNDTLGHNVGDELLIATAQRVQSCLRGGDTVARLGGDEFVVLLEDIEGSSRATVIANRILRELSTPFAVGGHEVFTSSSIGIAFGQPGHRHPEEVLRDADSAMYRAKAAGKARYALFEPGMREQFKESSALEDALSQALARREFVLFYQPILSMASGRVTGFEVLLRWQHPQHGLILPTTFLGAAEARGLLPSIGEWGLYEACRQVVQWQAERPDGDALHLQVNLSVRQVRQAGLAERVEAILLETGLPARSLQVEIAEPLVAEHLDMASPVFGSLRERGLRLGLDNFGSGLAALRYLHSIPFDAIKIDRSLLSQIDTGRQNHETVGAIIAAAHALGMEVTGVGVESKVQLAYLHRLKCDAVQGFLVGRPLSADAAGTLLRQTTLAPSPDPSPLLH